MKKRILSLFLVCMLVVTMVAFATDGEDVSSNEESITVYLSVSDNGDFVTSPVTNEKMARIPVEISHFDLAQYGLETFYNLNQESSEVIEKPTLLHLFIKVIENYYLDTVYNKEDAEHKAVFEVAGSAGMASLNRFWNHDYNLMYKVDRANPNTVDNPYATCDKIVIEDGDVITVGMFASQNWYLDGYFAYFDQYTDEITEDETVNFSVKGRPVFGDGTTDVPLDRTKVFAVKTANPDWILDENPEVIENIDENGTFEISFDTPGTYYITLLDNHATQTTATIIPDIVKITVNYRELPQYTGDWTSFRGSENNMGIVNHQTPVNSSKAELKWAVQYTDPTNWSDAVTPPILVDGKMYVAKNNKVICIDTADGSTIKESETLSGSVDYGTTSITYGGGMIFVPIGSGRIQALRVDTLESVWVSEELGGQTITPITYKDGKVFCGTYTYSSDELKEGIYFCISTEDEDKNSKTEIKECLWKISHQGGFYWAGAYVTSDFAVFGSDDTSAQDSTGNAVLYSVDIDDGTVTDTVDTVYGDIRSSIAYDSATDRLYFTTKGGKLGRVKLNIDGTFDDATYEEIDLGGASTSTPVVYDGLAYVGTAQNDGAYEYKIIDVNIAPMKEVASVATPGYAQASPLLSTSCKTTKNAVYLYFTYNSIPGGIYMVKMVKSDDAYEDGAAVVTVTDNDLFIPTDDMAQYCICSPICDSDGTIYYKNDSGYIMAITKKTETVQQPIYSGGGGGGGIDRDEEKEEDKKEEENIQDNIQEEVIIPIRFSDTKGHWAEEYISTLSDMGVIKGKGEDNFAPEDDITRAEFVTLLRRISQDATDFEEIFEDVPEGEWYSEAISWAYKNKITAGTDENKFSPNEKITREQAVVFIARFLGYKGVDVSAENTEEFADVNKISDWARTAVGIIRKLGIVSGKENNMFAPLDNATRAEVCKILVNMIGVM